MKFIIVVFIEDNQLEVVPKNWVKDGMCPWDRSPHFKKMVQAGDDFPKHFKLFAVRQVGDYETSMLKLFFFYLNQNLIFNI